jgi:signal transduction histidine kinase
VFTIGGLTAGAAAILGSMRSVYFTYIFVMMLPATIWFLQSGDEAYRLMGVMLCIYILAMMAAGYIYRRIVSYSIIVSEELIEAKNIAEAANQAKTDFLASMSREIRTPLNAVIGFAQILKADKTTPSDERQESSVDMVVDAGRHLLDLIAQVTDLAKIESSASPLKFVAVSYNELLEECIPLIQIPASKAGVIINNDRNEDNDYILWADKLRLKQVIINLLDNAIKYNMQGGSVSLTREKQKDNYLRIIISDTGQGIEKDKQKRLFKAFDRLGYENSQIEGTGIGLLMSQRIIEQMRGRIGFKSVQGQGSQFWIDVPSAK